MGGVFSVVGVFLTLRYYRKKDRNNYEIKKNEEREFIKKSRELNVRPYLRILPHLKSNISDYEQISIELKSDNYMNSSTKLAVLGLTNNGMGTALNVKCEIKSNYTASIINNGISLADKEVYAILMTVDGYFSSKGQNENIDFIFYFHDIFDNKYKQEINASLARNQYNNDIQINVKSIQSPSLE